MENQDNPSEGSVSEEQGASSAEGQENVEAPDLSLEDLNKTLGREYKSKDEALSSLKETYDFVGKAGSYQKAMKQLTDSLGIPEEEVLKRMEEQQNAPQKEEAKTEVDPEKYISREQYETDTFYAKNEKYSDYRPVIDSMAQAKGIKPAEVVELDEFKTIYEKATGYDEYQGKKSVLETNPRIGAATDKMTSARESMKEYNQASHSGDRATANRSLQQARDYSVKAVVDTFELG